MTFTPSLVDIKKYAFELFCCITENRMHMDQNGATMGLEHVFSRLRNLVPSPSKGWYREVFRNYDQDGDGYITWDEFCDIILQYYEYYRDSNMETREIRGQSDTDRDVKSKEGRRGGAAEMDRESEKVATNNSDKLNQPNGKKLQLQSAFMYPTHGRLSEVFEDYEFVDWAGEGAFGTVRRVRHKRSGELRAAKAIDINALNDHKTIIDREIELLKNLHHPNILKLYETYYNGNTIYLIMELCEGGELFDRIVHHYETLLQPITEGQVCEWVYQIISACSYCHKHGYVHRDIKPENVLFLDKSKNSPLKLIDFGLSDSMERIRSNAYLKSNPAGLNAAVLKFYPGWTGRTLRMQRAGTPHYMAPEMIKGSYDEKCDLFGVGIIMYQLLSGTHPFYTPDVDSEDKVKARILKEEVNMTGEIWDYVSTEAKELLTNLLQKNPKKRFAAHRALQSSWFIRMRSKTKETNLTRSVFEGLRTWQRNSGIKQALMRFLAKELPEARMPDLRNKFAMLDRKGEGMVSITELRETLISSSYKMNNAELENILSSLDGRDTGFIEYHDFISALVARELKDKTVIRLLFNKLDSKRRGYITMENLFSIFKVPGDNDLEATYRRVKPSFDEMDANNDGRVDFDEFRHFICKD